VNQGLLDAVAPHLLGLGWVEPLGALERPWLTMLRPGEEYAYGRSQVRVFCARAGGGSRWKADWLPGAGGHDVARFRYHHPALAELVSPAPVGSRLRPRSMRALITLWNDCGEERGAGGFIRVKDHEDAAVVIEFLRDAGFRSATPARAGFGRGISLSEADVRRMERTINPLLHSSILPFPRPRGELRGVRAVADALSHLPGDWARR
jgi:hypothetical protein